MQCPVCKTSNLVMTERQGIEIDYCPQCRGVWLDRGELDKIIERSTQDVAGAPRTTEAPRPRDDQRDHGRGFERDHDRDYDRDYRRHDDDRRHYESKHYRRKSLLSEIFDF